MPCVVGTSVVTLFVGHRLYDLFLYERANGAENDENGVTANKINMIIIQK